MPNSIARLKKKKLSIIEEEEMIDINTSLKTKSKKKFNKSGEIDSPSEKNIFKLPLSFTKFIYGFRSTDSFKLDLPKIKSEEEIKRELGRNKKLANEKLQKEISAFSLNLDD